MIETHGESTTSAHYSRLGRVECEKIHLASLEILQRVGIDVHDDTAREVLTRGGARADGLRVYIPEYMVARALGSAPSRLNLYDRFGKLAIRAGGYLSPRAPDCLLSRHHCPGDTDHHHPGGD